MKSSSLNSSTALCGLLLLISGIAAADTLILPAPVLDRNGIVNVTYKLDRQTTGNGRILIHWTDSLGRVVEDRTIPVELIDEDHFSFPIDLRRAVAMENTLHAHLSFDGKNMKQQAQHKEEDTEATFVARPPEKDWRDYIIIMWQQYKKDLIPHLEKLGINAGQYSGRSNSLPEFFIDNNMRWYSEGIGTDFYSTYHRYRTDRPYDWDLLQAKELLKKDPTSLEPFRRHPSFWDPVWRKKIHDRLVDDAKRNAPYRPVFYSLADESGIGDLAGFWDFDFSDQSLVPMRRWLRERYHTLTALNREWGTNYTSWDLVTPPTTHEAMQRKDDNFSAWADFKEWMDISFADALEMGTKAIHEVDPDAFVGVGGGQMPGWGGYDYARLTHALTEIEPYDIGSNIEIIRSLNPDMPMVTTGFANGKWEQHRVWYELLHNNRGLIIWDQKHEYVGDDGTPGERGREAGAYYNELRDGVGAQIINSQLMTDRIAIHYSQPSMRTEWMLARRPDGDAWITRSAKAERSDNDFLRLRESWRLLLEDEGLQYNFVSYLQLEQGELLKAGYRVLVLPQSSSLSTAEVNAIREFIAQGGMVIADGEPGTFDEHSRRLSQSPLADLFGGAHDQAITVHPFGKGKAIFLKTDTLNYHQNRLVHKEGPVHELVGNLLRSNGIRPEFAVMDAKGNPVVGVETHIYRNGGIRLITLISNPQLRVDELGPPDFHSNQRFENPVTVNIALPGPMYLYDVRGRKTLGQKRTLTVTVNPYEPIILAAAPGPLPELRVSAPSEARRGDLVRLGFDVPHTPASVDVIHLDVLDPQGKRAITYSGNVFTKDGHAMKIIPLAFNDDAGKWTIKIHDLLSGREQSFPLDVH
jgi:hypothetical protein